MGFRIKITLKTINITILQLSPCGSIAALTLRLRKHWFNDKVQNSLSDLLNPLVDETQNALVVAHVWNLITESVIS